MVIGDDIYLECVCILDKVINVCFVYGWNSLLL